MPLEVPEFGTAAVSVPLGAEQARPLLIALHGDADRPEWQCGSYRHVMGARGFALCVRGMPVEDGRFTLGAPADTAKELRVALSALKRRFGPHLANGEVVLSGLGPSVQHAIEIALQEPSFFSRLILVDGSTGGFSAATATRFGQAGGHRVLLVCSRGCDSDAQDRLRLLHPSGVATRFVEIETGSGLGAEAVARLATEWKWLISGDPRWK